MWTSSDYNWTIMWMKKETNTNEISNSETWLIRSSLVLFLFCWYPVDTQSWVTNGEINWNVQNKMLDSLW